MNGSDTSAVAETVDQTLIEHYRVASATGTQFRGLSIMHHDRDLRRLVVRACGPKSENVRLLDYGCGLGHQYDGEHYLHKRMHVPRPTLYDPGVVGLDTKPTGTFDGVICSDVMEHVPERLVDNVLAEVFGYAEKFVWISVCCRPAKKFFEDGTNLHVTVKPQAWWRARVAAAAKASKCPVYELVFTP